jgi:hypothetical protein
VTVSSLSFTCHSPVIHLSIILKLEIRPTVSGSLAYLRICVFSTLIIFHVTLTRAMILGLRGCGLHVFFPLQGYKGPAGLCWAGSAADRRGRSGKTPRQICASPLDTIP